ncbi:MAG: YhcB family protein [Pseudomonadales bacterium]
MDSIGWIWLSAIIAGVAGWIGGWLLGRHSNSGQRKSLALQESLNASEQRLQDYKREVQDHFVQTADAIKQMNDSYQSLHQRLASGASALCGDMEDGPLLDKPSGRRADDPEAGPQEELPLEPPLDYAPKKGPADKGVLNEDFGLEKVRASNE